MHYDWKNNVFVIFYISESTPDLLLWNQNPPPLTKKSQNDTLIVEIEQKLTDLNAQKLSVEECIRQNEALGQGITCLGRISHKKSQITIFGHKLKISSKNLIF